MTQGLKKPWVTLTRLLCMLEVFQLMMKSRAILGFSLVSSNRDIFMAQFCWKLHGDLIYVCFFVLFFKKNLSLSQMVEWLYVNNVSSFWQNLDGGWCWDDCICSPPPAVHWKCKQYKPPFPSRHVSLLLCCITISFGMERKKLFCDNKFCLHIFNRKK